MRSDPPPAPLSRSILLLIVLAVALSACAAPIVTGQSAGCSTLIPATWRQPVEGTDLPPVDAGAGDLWVALDGQTGQLDKANGRTADTIAIVEGCEARDRAAIKRATRPWWKFW